MSQRNYNRREFLSKSTTGLASVGILGAAGTGLNPSVPSKKPNEVIHRTLGKTGLRVPVIGFGVMNTTDPNMISASHKEGVKLFDTALRYHNEDMIGDAVEKLGIRDQIILETKVPVPDYQNPGSMSSEDMYKKFLEDFDGCLERLKTDNVDILFFHNIKFMKDMHDPRLRQALEEIKESKRATHIGVSTHSIHEDVLNEAVKQSDLYSVAQISYSFAYSIIPRYKPRFEAINEAIKNAAENDIGLIAMKTQGLGGNLSAVGPKHHTAMLKWVLQNENITCAIPGYTNIDQMKEDFSVVYDIGLDEEEEESLRLYEERFGESSPSDKSGFCLQCNECVQSCPEGVDIPTLMRTHMYASGYSNFGQARETMYEISGNSGLENCSTCKKCTALCVNNAVDISEKIKDLKLLYA